MKTATDKNESYFDKMKRQSEEWLEKYPAAPPFLHLALAEFKEPQPVTMWDVNHLGARELIIEFMEWYYDDVGGIDDYTIKHIDEYIEHRKREQEAADEDYRKHGKAT